MKVRMLVIVAASLGGDKPRRSQLAYLNLPIFAMRSAVRTL